MKIKFLPLKVIILSVVFFSLCKAQEDSIDYKKIRIDLINKYLDLIDQSINYKTKMKKTDYDTLLIWKDGKLYLGKLKWLNDKDFFENTFTQTIVSLNEANENDSKMDRQKTFPIFETHSTYFNNFYYSISFQRFEDVFLGTYYGGCYFTDREKQIIGKRISLILGSKLKLYEYDFNSVHLQIYNKKIKSRGWYNRRAVFELLNLKDWMYDENIIEYGSVEKYITNYGIVNGIQKLNWKDNINSVKKKLNVPFEISKDKTIITYEDVIANNDVFISCTFLKNGLGSINIRFCSSQGVDKDGSKLYYTSFSLTDANKIFNDVSKLLVQKYGIYSHKHDIEHEGSQNYFNNGNNIRVKELAWSFSKTHVVFSIDELPSEDTKSYIIQINYFSNDYFDNRENDWKDKL